MFKISNVMIGTGILIALLGAGNAWYQYRINHSPLDVVDTSLQSMDQDNNFIPLIQPQNDQKAPTISVPGSPSEPSLNTPEALSTQVATPVELQNTVKGLVPDRLKIPAIGLDAPILPIKFKTITYQGQTLEQWLVPNQFAVGWHDTSALLGLPGNTVLNGHHNADGEVFKDLIKLELGDTIEVYSGNQIFDYQVTARMLLPERYQPLKVRIANAQWIMPSDDERLTLITCWPADSNTSRVVIVAFPVKK